MGWWTDPSLLTPAIEPAFGTIDGVHALPPGRFSHKARTDLIRVEIDGTGYWAKRYKTRGGRPERVFRSKLRQEQQNLRRLEQLGVPTPPLVAWGEEGWWDYRGALVTREVPGALDLREIAFKHPEHLRSRDWKHEVSDQLAGHLRRMHAAGFVHYDLKWRNVLIQPEVPKVYLIDCPAGRRTWGPNRNYMVLRDLEALDKPARELLTRSERMRFFHRYTGHERLTGDDRRLLRRLVRYRERSLLRFLP